MNVHESVVQRLQTIRAAKRFNPQKWHDDLEPVFAEKGFREPSDRIDNILIIRLDVMGDMILTSGVFREVRRNYPEAHIAAIVGEPVLPLMEFCPYCDELFTFDRRSLNNNLAESIEQMETLCETHLRQRRYDLCLLPQWGDDRRTSQLLAYLSGARERVGYSEASLEAYIDHLDIDTSFETAFLTRSVVNPPELIHEVVRNFYLLKILGMTVKDSSTEIWMSEEDMESASALLLSRVPEGCIVVALGIGAGGASRKYPIKKYLTAIRAIL
nr:glycosyltransferase family 9 protein [Schwartzia sp. (in: firmicutes)]